MKYEYEVVNNIAYLKICRKGMPSKTGIRGVYWCNTYNKYVARITVNKKVHHIGYFTDVSEAEKAIKEARAKLMPYSKEGSL